MTEKPIMFSAPMVRAVLDGRKTQTRRLAKPRRHASLFAGNWTDSFITDPGNRDWLMQEAAHRPGEGMWVRENFSGPHALSGEKPSAWPTDSPIWYWADGDPEDGDWTKPKPSIHMPRWASRIDLHCNGARVERLHAISEADAVAEGVGRIFPKGSGSDTGPNYFTVDTGAGCSNAPTAAAVYRMLWCELHGEASWDANPLVWVYSFERQQQPHQFTGAKPGRQATVGEPTQPSLDDRSEPATPSEVGE